MQNKILPIIVAVIIIIAVCIIILIPSSQEENIEIANLNNNETSKQANQAKSIEASLTENGDIEIKFEDLATSNATFIQYTSNGIIMELIAIKDSDNNVKVAFNTCQICNGSPKAYFVQTNGKLICQNCGNVFSLKSIGDSGNGCNPMTISNEYINKTSTGIAISKEFLNQNEILFKNVVK